MWTTFDKDTLRFGLKRLWYTKSFFNYKLFGKGLHEFKHQKAVTSSTTD